MSSKPVLVADIGGTNARFAVAQRVDGRFVLDHIRVLAVEGHPTIASAASDYLSGLGSAGEIGHAVFALACAVGTDAIKLTNSPWSFSVRQLRADLRLPGLRVVNDFAALSMAVPHLMAGDLEAIGSAAPAAEARASGDRSYATIGPGTGLGVGGLRIGAHGAVVIESEGGHVGFAPGNDFELAILKVLLGKYERVSNERLISGAGLVNLYQAICAIEGVRAEHAEPQAIVAEADAIAGGTADRTLQTFCAVLGSVAGDVALALGAWDGVFIGGGIAQKLSARLRQSAFRARFEAKGRHASLMQRIPTSNILHPAVGLLGAAAYAVGE